ncbi:putative glycosyl transferase [Leptolyngbya sp. NIES-3755]|nr:putative glycosyl transferase [Leptolyngbya sp. NIES-3755]
MTKKPVVSIIVNNYNYAQFLPIAIESALSQTYPDVEVIVVDDGSIDRSRTIIQQYGSSIKAVLKENGGQSSAFNAGFQASTGEIICFLDSDDYFMPDKISAIVEVFNQHPEIDWCFHGLKLIDKNANLIPSKTTLTTRLWDFRDSIRQGQLLNVPTATSALCFRQSLLKQILPMPEEIKITSDNYIKYLALALGKGMFLSNQLAVQRIHGDNHYTFNPNLPKLQEKTLFLTAYWIEHHFPFLYQLADSLFSAGIALSWRNQKSDPAHKELIQQYFSSISLLRKLRIQQRSIVYFIKGLIKQFMNAQKP